MNGFPSRLGWVPAYASRLQRLARSAGDCALRHRSQATQTTKHKPDGSPVTNADLESHSIIVQGLQDLMPGIPIVAEEQPNPAELAASGTYWLVDPLDGTSNYVRGGDEFTVNIALLSENAPLLGLIYAPACHVMYYGDPQEGALRIDDCCQTPLCSGAQLSPEAQRPSRLTLSRREEKSLPLEAWKTQGIIESWALCSSALKFAHLAQGACELYPRFGPTYEWDTAAGDALLRLVGGGIITPQGVPLSYGKPSFLNGSFIAYAPGRRKETVEVLRQRMAHDMAHDTGHDGPG